MIVIHMTLVPQGVGLFREGILDGTIWTTDDGKFHSYYLCHGGSIFNGQIPKAFSGSKNPLKLLAKIIKDIENNA